MTLIRRPEELESTIVDGVQLVIMVYESHPDPALYKQRLASEGIDLTPEQLNEAMLDYGVSFAVYTDGSLGFGLTKAQGEVCHQEPWASSLDSPYSGGADFLQPEQVLDLLEALRECGVG